MRPLNFAPFRENLDNDTAMNSDKDDIRLKLFHRLGEAEEAWRKLGTESLGTPYQSYAWLSSWQETIGRKQGLETLTAILQRQDEALLILPFAVQRKNGLRRLSFLAHQNGNQNTGLWNRPFYQSVDSGFISQILKDICQQSRADLLTLHNVPENWFGRPHPLVLKKALPSPSPIFTRQLPADFDQLFRETHSKSSRKNLARKQRHLQSVEGYRVVKAMTPQDLERGFQAFLAQRATRARETGIPNVFSNAEARDFLAAVVGVTRADDRADPAPLNLWYLEADGKIRATYLCAEGGHTIYAYSNSVAHDELLPNSPGLVLIREIIEYACGSCDLERLDLGLGEERYKTAWAEAASLRDSRLAVTTRGRIAERLDGGGTKLKAAIRNSEPLWAMVKKAAQDQVRARQRLTTACVTGPCRRPLHQAYCRSRFLRLPTSDGRFLGRVTVIPTRTRSGASGNHHFDAGARVVGQKVCRALQLVSVIRRAGGNQNPVGKTQHACARQ